MTDLKNTCKYYAEEITASYDNGELWEYLNDNMYDVELRIGLNKDLRSVQLMLAGGGPTIYLDTQRRGIIGYHGREEAYYGISMDICDEVEEMFADSYGYDR